MANERPTFTNKLNSPEYPTTLADMGINLNRTDLIELIVRLRAAQIAHSPRILSGALSFPAHVVQGDSDIRGMVQAAQDSGRFTQSLHRPGHGEGNIVLYPTGKQNDGLAQLMASADRQTLSPIAGLCKTVGGAVDGILLQPNASKGKLNGVQIRMQPQAKKWWQWVPAAGNIRMGRGISLSSIDMSAYEFINKSDDILAKVRAIAGALPPGAVKYVSFLYVLDEQMFLCIAGGPSTGQSKQYLSELGSAPRASDASVIIADSLQTGFDTRTTLLRQIAGELRTEIEEVSDHPYASVDFETATIFSGAINPGGNLQGANGLNLFTAGEDSLLVSLRKQDGIIPLGVKLPTQTPPLIPKGVLPNKPGDPLVVSPPMETIMRLVDPTRTLITLAVSYHQGWRSAPPKQA